MVCFLVNDSGDDSGDTIHVEHIKLWNDGEMEWKMKRIARKIHKIQANWGQPGSSKWPFLYSYNRNHAWESWKEIQSQVTRTKNVGLDGHFIILETWYSFLIIIIIIREFVLFYLVKLLLRRNCLDVTWSEYQIRNMLCQYVFSIILHVFDHLFLFQWQRLPNTLYFFQALTIATTLSMRFYK